MLKSFSFDLDFKMLIFLLSSRINVLLNNINRKGGYRI